MIARFRDLAPAALLIALLSGQAGTGVIAAHVFREHGSAAEAHGHHDAEHDPGHRDDVQGGDRSGSHHVPEHTHQIAPSLAAAPARIADRSSELHTLLAVVAERRLDSPSFRTPASPSRPVLRAGPPESGRNSILLL